MVKKRGSESDIQALARSHIHTLRKTVRDLGIGVSVEDNLRSVDASRYRDQLTCGLVSFHDDLVAVFLSSAGSTYRGMPIKTLLIPPNLEGSLATDSSNQIVGTGFFFEIDRGTITLVQTTEPVPLCGVCLSYTYDGAREYQGPLRLNNELSITASKISTNEILGPSVPIPSWAILSSSSDLAGQINNFISINTCSGFVIKGDTGSGAKNVRLFENNEISRAVDYVKYLFGTGQRVFIQERVIPIEWREGDALLDWNLRTLVTASPEPKWIDAEVRFSKRSNMPVNVSNGARLEELEILAHKIGLSVEEIKQVSIRATRTILQAIGGVPVGIGFIGLDLMVSDNGIFIIEANSGAVGGLASLCKHRRNPLSSVRTLLEELGQFLLQNKQTEQLILDSPLPISYRFTESALSHLAIGNFQKAIDSFHSAIKASTSRNLLCEAYNYIGACYMQLGLYDEAIKYLEMALEIDPHKQEAMINKAQTIAFDKPLEALDLLSDLSDSTSFLIPYVRARSYYKLGRHADAIAESEKAIKANPHNAASHCLLADIYASLKRFSDAETSIKIAMALDPDSPNIAYHYASILIESGKVDEGLNIIHAFLKLYPDDEGLLELLDFCSSPGKDPD